MFNAMLDEVGALTASRPFVHLYRPQAFIANGEHPVLTPLITRHTLMTTLTMIRLTSSSSSQQILCFPFPVALMLIQFRRFLGCAKSASACSMIMTSKLQVTADEKSIEKTTQGCRIVKAFALEDRARPGRAAAIERFRRRQRSLA